MALKVDARIKGYGPHPARTRALVTVIVEFEGPQETLEINVLRKSIRQELEPGKWVGVYGAPAGCRERSSQNRRWLSTEIRDGS
jgi:hypothetical protein